MHFEIIGELTAIEKTAAGSAIRHLALLQREYGPGRWLKMKGIAVVQLGDGTLRKAELHWYEAHGIGRKRIKIKRFLD